MRCCARSGRLAICSPIASWLLCGMHQAVLRVCGAAERDAKVVALQGCAGPSFPDEDLSEDELEWDDFGCSLRPDEFLAHNHSWGGKQNIVTSAASPLQPAHLTATCPDLGSQRLEAAFSDSGLVRCLPCSCRATSWPINCTPQDFLHQCTRRHTPCSGCRHAGPLPLLILSWLVNHR